MLLTVQYWTQILNLIMQLYLKETTLCVIWNPNFEFVLKNEQSQNYSTIVNINLKNLQKSFDKDIEDFTQQHEYLLGRGLTFNELTEKLTMAIEKSHCESFLVFQNDILPFIESFNNASQYSVWRSKRNRFVFAYVNNNIEENIEKNITENIKENPEKSITEDTEENTEKNIEQNIEENIELNIDTNLTESIEQNTETNITESSEQNTEQNIEENIETNFTENIEENTQKTIEQNTDKNIKQNIAEKFFQNIEANNVKKIGKNIDENIEQNFIEHPFFADQPNILLIQMYSSLTSVIFNLKTNKFIGPKYEKQYSLLLLDRYFANNQTFLYNNSLFPDKLRNLQGREVVVAGFDYRPYFVINYVKSDNNSYDLALNGESGMVQIDGTEARPIMTFCEIHNCSVLIDSSEADDWGEVYPNLTGDASLGMLVKGSAEISIGAMYSWDVDYVNLDLSMYLVRSGITCLVPAPRRLASWLLPLEPFQLTLWLAVVFYTILEIISLCCTHKYESWVLSDPSNSWRRSFKFAYVISLKLFVSQSGNASVRSVTSRVLLFSCFMNDIIITSIYGGGLASILTIPSYGKAADTLDGMFSQHLKWAANSEAWVSAIRKADDPRTIGILNNFHIYTDEELEVLARTRWEMGFTVERLPFGHFAIGDYLSSKSIEHLKIMQEDLYFQYTVAFVKRCWPYLGQFDELIYWWHSAGLDKYWEWRTVATNLNVQKQKQVEATMYSNADDMGPIKLGMSNFVGILIIWVLGISIALMAFAYELLQKYLKAKKETNDIL